MRRLRQLLFRFQPLWSRERIELELSEELRTHLEMATAANIAAGMTPDAALRAAQLELGGVEQVKEAYRDQRGLPWLEHLAQDLNYAARQMRKNPGLTTVAALSLALGIGASTAIFGLANQLLLTPLPVRNPEQLVQFNWTPGPGGAHPQGYSGGQDEGPTSGRPTYTSFSLRTFEWFAADHPLLSDIFAFALLGGPHLAIDGQPEVGGRAQLVSGNYYTALGVGVFRGRVLGREDDSIDAVPAAVVSHRFWRSRLGGNENAIGKTIRVNQIPVTIVGVAPPGFLGPLLNYPADITLPLAVAPLVMGEGGSLSRPGQWWLRIMGRLHPGVSAERARISLESSFKASARDGLNKLNDFPDLLVAPAGSGRSARGREQIAQLLKPRVAMVTLLLAAAGANLGNLLLARAAARRREFGVRLALGASRGRLVRQLLVESILLAALGAGLGSVLAIWGGGFLSSGPGESFAFDLRVLGFTIAVALATGIGFGLAPALRATRLDLTAEFQGGAHAVGSRSRTGLSRTLMVVQVAISFVLLVGAGLLSRSLLKLRAVEVGFDRSNLLLFSVDGFSTGHTVPELAGLYTSIATRIGTQPGVRAATYSAGPILSGFDGGRALVSIPPDDPATGDPGAASNEVGPGFFNTLGIPIIAGRGFDERDYASSRLVIVINRAFARKYFGAANPVGRQVQLGNTIREVIGVAGDVKQIDLRREIPPTVFAPAGPKLHGAVHFAVRSTVDAGIDPALMRQAVQDVDPNLPVANFRRQEEEIDRLLVTERVFTTLATFFGTVALVLAGVGLYGLASYTVHSRIPEFGVRTALGAQPRHLCWMILRESLVLALAGVVLGIAAAAAAVRFLASLLFGLSPTDPLTYGAAALVLIAGATLAVARPARQVAKIDPVAALRWE